MFYPRSKSNGYMFGGLRGSRPSLSVPGFGIGVKEDALVEVQSEKPEEGSPKDQQIPTWLLVLNIKIVNHEDDRENSNDWKFILYLVKDTEGNCERIDTQSGNTALNNKKQAWHAILHDMISTKTDRSANISIWMFCYHDITCSNTKMIRVIHKVWRNVAHGCPRPHLRPILWNHLALEPSLRALISHAEARPLWVERGSFALDRLAALINGYHGIPFTPLALRCSGFVFAAWLSAAQTTHCPSALYSCLDWAYMDYGSSSKCA